MGHQRRSARGPASRRLSRYSTAARICVAFHCVMPTVGRASSIPVVASSGRDLVAATRFHLSIPDVWEARTERTGRRMGDLCASWEKPGERVGERPGGRRPRRPGRGQHRRRERRPRPTTTPRPPPAIHCGQGAGAGCGPPPRRCRRRRTGARPPPSRAAPRTRTRRCRLPLVTINARGRDQSRSSSTAVARSAGKALSAPVACSHERGGVNAVAARSCVNHHCKSSPPPVSTSTSRQPAIP